MYNRVKGNSLTQANLEHKANYTNKRNFRTDQRELDALIQVATCVRDFTHSEVTQSTEE
jgi:hypothetical protein